MVVQHNMPSMFTQRELKAITGQTEKSVEKLTSGYRVNRSADDAAGLSISEKMRWQIKGLDKGSINCRDGGSFCQVADGAMQEIEDMLHRMKELTIQGANDTNTAADRWAIQQELNELVVEINRITTDTDFNTLKVFGQERTITEIPIDNPNATPKVVKKSFVQDVQDVGLIEILKNDMWNKKYLNSPLMFEQSGSWKSTGAELYTPGSVTSASVVNTINSLMGTTDADSYVHSAISTDSIVTYSSDNKIRATYTYSGGYTNFDGKKMATQITVESGSMKDGKFVADKTLKSYSLTDTINGSNVVGSTGYTNDMGYGSAWMDFKGLGKSYQLEDLYNQGFNSRATANGYCNVKFTGKGPASTLEKSGGSVTLSVNISGSKSGADVVKKVFDALNDPANASFTANYNTQYAYDEKNPTKLYVYDNGTYFKESTSSSAFEPVIRDSNGKAVIPDTVVHDTPNGVIRKISSQGLWIQSGATEKSGFFIERAMVSASLLGVENLRVDDFEKATKSISQVDAAVVILNEERSKMGAQMNRLERASLVDDNISENSQAAESRIRDTDMAKEMVEYSKNNILAQAGQSLLVQANQQPQGVLTLLG